VVGVAIGEVRLNGHPDAYEVWTTAVQAGNDSWPVIELHCG
jgi:hypothetical protein